MKSLEDYLKQMKTNDVVKATQEARMKNAALLNDQGLAAIAILFSDILAEVIKSPEILLPKLAQQRSEGKEITNASAEQPRS
ncbi:TPA: hypothetical protein EYP66_06745 [Candidatus Poribacteria bacterium]|nr:hypothetical protein [Candidatus Poribacteria bacterium]